MLLVRRRLALSVGVGSDRFPGGCRAGTRRGHLGPLRGGDGQYRGGRRVMGFPERDGAVASCRNARLPVAPLGTSSEVVVRRAPSRADRSFIHGPGPAMAGTSDVALPLQSGTRRVLHSSGLRVPRSHGAGRRRSRRDEGPCARVLPFRRPVPGISRYRPAAREIGLLASLSGHFRSVEHPVGVPRRRGPSFRPHRRRPADSDGDGIPRPAFCKSRAFGGSDRGPVIAVPCRTAR